MIEMRLVDIVRVSLNMTLAQIADQIFPVGDIAVLANATSGLVECPPLESAAHSLDAAMKGMLCAAAFAAKTRSSRVA